MDSGVNGTDSAEKKAIRTHLVAIPADQLHRLRRLSAELTEALAIVTCPVGSASNSTPPAHGSDRAAARPDLPTWFAQRINYLRTTGQRSSREEDHDAALAAGFAVDRETIRELRRELTPPEWQLPGRPRR